MSYTFKNLVPIFIRSLTFKIPERERDRKSNYLELLDFQNDLVNAQKVYNVGYLPTIYLAYCR